jgi:putative ABC transport system permease protein
MLIILAESLMLAGGGGLLGMVLGHTLNAAAAPIVERQTGVEIGFWDFAPPIHPLELFGIESGSPWKIWPELMLIPLLVGLAVLVGLLPAMSAYRTDVADSLGK